MYHNTCTASQAKIALISIYSINLSYLCSMELGGVCNILLVICCIPYSGKPLKEKTFVNFMALWLFAKVFSAKFGARHSLAQQNQATCESFLSKNHIFHQFAKVFFLPLKLPTIR